MKLYKYPNTKIKNLTIYAFLNHLHSSNFIFLDCIIFLVDFSFKSVFIGTKSYTRGMLLLHYKVFFLLTSWNIYQVAFVYYYTSWIFMKLHWIISLYINVIMDM